jgi:AcrR family transcriptional regulator
VYTSEPLIAVSPRGDQPGESAAPVLIAHRRVNEARWGEILDAAAAEFNAVGYKAARLRDIARRLDLTARSLYHYIESKEDLLYEILLDAHRHGVADVLEMQKQADDPRDRLRLLVIGWGKFVATARYILVERDLRFLRPEYRADIVTRRRTLHRLAREIIEDGKSSGCFDHSLDSAVVANSLFGVLASTRYWFRSGGPVSIDELYGWYADVFIRGLGPDDPGRS